MSWSILVDAVHKEFENFSHTITYIEEVEEGMPTKTYFVRIIPQQVNPDSVVIVSDVEMASISGFFRFTFNDTIQYLAKDRSIKTFDTLSEPPGGAWQKVDLDDVSEMVSFKADVTRERQFDYFAEAYDSESPGVVVSTNNYTIIVRDLDWTPGQIALKDAVAYASS
jgi:hypothetical protein